MKGSIHRCHSHLICHPSVGSIVIGNFDSVFPPITLVPFGSPIYPKHPPQATRVTLLTLTTDGSFGYQTYDRLAVDKQAQEERCNFGSLGISVYCSVPRNPPVLILTGLPLRQMNPSFPHLSWSTTSQIDTPTSISPIFHSTAPEDAFQESYFEKLLRVRLHTDRKDSQGDQGVTGLGLSISPDMSTPVTVPVMSAHPWQNTPLWAVGQPVPVQTSRPHPVPTQPTQPTVNRSIGSSSISTPASATMSGSSGSSSNSRFDQLLRAKLAAEKKAPAGSAPSMVHVAPAGFDAALAKLQSADTVVNRAFIAPQYNTPQVVVQKAKSPAPLSPNVPSSSSLPAFPTFYGYPIGSQPMPVSPQQSMPSPINSGPTPLSPLSFDRSTLGSEQMAANFRSMVAQRINNMYATAQMQENISRSVPELSKLQVPDTQPVYGSLPSSPVSPFTPHSPQFPTNYGPMASPTMPQNPTTPVFKLNQYNVARGSVDMIKVEPDWNAGPYQQPCQPFLLNVTPPQNVAIGGPTYSHSASGSIDSAYSVSPVTPQFGPFPSFPTPVDVKPIISPALSNVTLPDEQSYRRYSQGLLVPMNAKPQFTGASTGDGQSNGGDMPYNLGGHDDGFDGSNGLNGLDFGDGGLGNGNGDDGSGGDGGGDDNDQNGDDNQGNSGPSRAPRGKKLPLACHFCRRRKLKCDGIKPVCENCNKRGIECTYDDHVRRRGPGKRTKPRGPAGNEPTHVEYDTSTLDIPQDGLEHHLDPTIPDVDDHDGVGEIDHSDLLLDPALAGENGDAARADDVMEAMGALKQAGIELGLHTDDGLGEPSTLAELGQLSEAFARQHHVQFGEDDDLDADGRKRKSDLLDFGDLGGLEGLDHKRLRLDDANGFSEVLAEQHQHQMQEYPEGGLEGDFAHHVETHGLLDANGVNGDEYEEEQEEVEREEVET